MDKAWRDAARGAASNGDGDPANCAAISFHTNLYRNWQPKFRHFLGFVTGSRLTVSGTREGSRAQAFEIRPGDIVHIAPNENHWHGAAPDHFLIHIAITPHPDGKRTNWAQKVSDAKYDQHKQDQ